MYREKAGITKPLPNTVVAALTSGLLYSIITMPFETAKNRMAAQKPDAAGKLAYRGTFQTIGLVARTSGPLQLWAGFFPYYLRCGGHTITMFVAVEQMRKWYVDMNSVTA